MAVALVAYEGAFFFVVVEAVVKEEDMIDD